MNWKKQIVWIIVIYAFALLTACQEQPTATEATATPDNVVIEVEPTAESIETTIPAPEPTATLTEPTAAIETGNAPLPERAGPRTQTTGTVPHVQIDVEPVTAVNDELHRLAFALPGVEDRPTIVSLPGARGMWLIDDVPVINPQAIVSGREFAHTHPDGSLHAPLPYERALEVTEKGWGERHPWADERAGWEGFVMLFTPQSMAELDITFQLIVESYNYVTGETLQASDIQVK